MDYNEAEDAVKVIQRLNQYAESLCQKLQDARAWAALWKRAAKSQRAGVQWALDGYEIKCAENKRLRETLGRVIGHGIASAFYTQYPEPSDD